jgi:DNA-binding response OmpR family regulator
MASILLITPDSSFEEYAQQVLAAAGHQVVTAVAGQAVRTSLSFPVDIVVVDSLAENVDETREQLDRQRRIPFVFVAPSTIPIREGDRFVQKPATPEHLREAVSDILATAFVGPIVDLGGVTFDRPGQRIGGNGNYEQLTPLEYRLLDYLLSRRGQIAATDQLLQNVWNYNSDTASSDVVRSHLKNLRAKIRRVNDGQDLIETIPRRGYRLS